MVSVVRKNECLFCKRRGLASIGDESHPLFLKVEQLCLVGESPKMCLIRGSKKAILVAPERWAGVCTARMRERVCLELAQSDID